MTRASCRLGMALLVALAVAGCDILSSDSGGGVSGQTPTSGSGTSTDPYVMQEGTKYKTSIVGYDILTDYVYFVFTASTTSTYTATLKGSADLALALFEGSTSSFVAECDGTDSGTEKCPSADIGLVLSAGTLYYLGVWNWDNKAVDFSLVMQPD